MSKTLKIYIVLLILIFLGVIAIEFSKEKPIDWSKTYNETHKKPYGTLIFYEQLKNLFPNNDIKNIRKTPYEYFNELYNWKDKTYTTKGTYIQVRNYINIDDASVYELLDFASHGNTVFISSNLLKLF